MKSVLAFPPPANPTTIPLGLASLAPFIRQQCPHCDLVLLDLNLSAWITLAHADPAGPEFLRFMRGQQHDFYHAPTYDQYKVIWNSIRQHLQLLAMQAQHYVEEGHAAGDCPPLLDVLAGQLLASDPDLVGFSVMYPAQLVYAVALALRIKHLAASSISRQANRRLRVVLGGAAMSTVCIGELLLACPAVDAVLPEEGEHGAAALCSDTRWEEIPGLIFRTATGLRTNSRVAVLALEHLPNPEFSDFPLTQYLSPELVLPLTSSRSCDWRQCRFCAHNLTFGRYRVRSPLAVLHSMEHYQRQHGARHFYFADQYVSAARAAAISEQLIQHRLSMVFHFMGRPTLEHTPQNLEQCAAAGCCWISWGIETGAQRLLDLSRKGTNVSTITRVLKETKRAGISNLAMMIFGLPTSTETDLLRTFRFLEEVYPDLDAMTASTFVLFAETSFGRRASRYALHVLGPQVVLQTTRGVVHSSRLVAQVQKKDGSLAPLPGPWEVATWERRKAWLPLLPLDDLLCAEHYLLFAERHASTRLHPLPFPRAA